MIKVFDKLSEYYTYVNGGLNSGDIYFVTEDESAHFQTNNIDGELKVYDLVSEDVIPGDSDGDIVAVLVNASFTENGVYDPADYDADGFASVTVSVPVPEGYVQPSGNLSISANASSIDVAQYATVAVNVPVPDGYVLPSGNLNITSNASSINVANYETVSVSVAAPAPSLSWNTLSGTSLEMNIGTTYVFKTNVSGVYMWHLGEDTDGNGEIDPIDDEARMLGQLTANSEYYFTSLNAYNDGDGNTKSYMYFSGTWDNTTALPAGAVIQYAVLS